MTAGFSWPNEPAVAEDTTHVDVWVAVMEFACGGGGRSLWIDEVDALLEQLQLWHPSCLWSPDRYAVQLRVPARSAKQAVQWALTYHLEAVLALGLPAADLVRVEVLTYDEMERAWQEPESAPVAGGVIRELYEATRALTSATTAADVRSILEDFVVAVGGTVETETPRCVVGTIAVSMGGDPERHAIAEALSVTGLVLEQALPDLLNDADRALARIQGSVSAAESRAARSAPTLG